MYDYDEIYNFLNAGREKQKRENFDTFMTTLISGLEKDLDDSYAGISRKNLDYETSLSNVKEFGFKVFRNSQGKHKLKMSDPVALNAILTGGPNAFDNIF